MEAVKRVLAVMVIALTLFTGQGYAEEVKLFVNGQEIPTEVPPVLDNGTTLVPVRFVSEALGAKVVWDEETESVFISGPAAVALKIGSKQASKNGLPAELLHEPVVVNGRTMVPVRFIAEAFGCSVDWDDGRVLIQKQSSEQQAAQPEPARQEGPPVDKIEIEWH